MLWQTIPAPALRRLRSSRALADHTAPRGQTLDRHVLNVLGALRLTGQELRLFRGEATEPCLTRILHVDERQRHFHLTRSAACAPVSAALGKEPASLFGALGRIWLLMPCQLLGDPHLGDAAWYHAELPQDVLYLEIRRAPRVRTDLALSALWPGACRPLDCRVTDLSEEGLGFEVPTAHALLPQPGQAISNAILHLPEGQLAALDLEVIHSRDAKGTIRVGARFRLASRSARTRLRRWLEPQNAPHPGGDAQLAGVVNRSMR